MVPPMSPVMADSVRNWAAMWVLDAPRDRRRPIFGGSFDCGYQGDVGDAYGPDSEDEEAEGEEESVEVGLDGVFEVGWFAVGGDLNAWSRWG